jgi:tetratricopeptide (TPR) repeat protein
MALVLALALASLGTIRGTFATAAPANAGTTVVPPPSPVLPPHDFTDVQGWINYREANDLPAMPAQATILYRLGVEASRQSDPEGAVRLWRGAEELDPGALAPRLTLAGHFLGRDPSQGLMELSRIVALLRSSFRLQNALVVDMLFFVLTALALATLGVALLLAFRHRGRLVHVYGEILAAHLPAPRARLWGWALFLLPWCLGLGVAIPAVFTLALLWSYLKSNERFVLGSLVALLVASPAALNLFDQLSLPAHETRAPFYRTVDLDREAYSPDRLAGFAALSATHPDNGFLAFVEGWMAQKGGKDDEAVAAYERAERLWPDEARIPNNLGNIEFRRANPAQAEIHYKRAIELAPRWAAAHYNLGQLYTARFRYAEASEEVATATALDFDLVRNLQARSASENTAALAEEWLEPQRQWNALFAAPRHGDPASLRSSTPPAWRPWFESRGMPVAIWTALWALLGVVLGLVLRHHLPARVCGNCGAAVCRRCATRRRDQVLCEMCAALVLTATTPEFGRLLLFKRRRETRRRQGYVRTAIAAIVPGYGWIALERVIGGWILAAFATGGTLFITMRHAPIPYDPRVIADAPRPLTGVVLAGLAIVCLVSLTGYLSLQAQAKVTEAGLSATPVKGRERLQRAA